ncbi:hypothetical protein [Kitasatospora sp. NPDC088351]|uniref:hypothetical protein n=1 Tax=Kitasatospora sp. NPDC088351 TaxID=3155180 RepID=UPI003431EB84
MAVLASSASATLTANNWNTVPLTATLAANTPYWPACNSNGACATVNNMNYSTGATGQGAHSNTVVPFGSRQPAAGRRTSDRR